MTKERLVVAPVGDARTGALDPGEHRIEKLPVVDEQERCGLITVKDIEKRIRHPHAKDSLGRLRVAAAVGAGGDYRERAAELVRAGVDALVSTALTRTRAACSPRRNACVRTIPKSISWSATSAPRKRAIARLARRDAVKVGMGPARSVRPAS
jgi:IMP dehydrogenase